MRLFTAIRPSPAAEEALLAAQAELRRLGRGSFPRREMLHLTLAFLGETADAAAAEAAVEALRGAGPISLTVEGVGQFGDTWWAGVGENPGLERLALGHQAGECVGCQSCESRCPFGVEISRRMRETAKLFGR